MLTLYQPFHVHARREGNGGMISSNKTEDVLAEVAAIKRRQAEQQISDTLASLLAGAPTK